MAPRDIRVATLGGRGDNPYQRSGDWLARVEEISPGKTEKEVAEIMELSTGDLRIFKSIAKNERTLEQIKAIKSMTGDGLGPTEIGRKLGIGESQVRALMKEGKEKKINSAQEIADHIKKEVDSRGYIDVGKGVEREINDPVTGNHISREKLEQALAIMRGEGYMEYGVGVKQANNPKQQTITEIMAPPGTDYKTVIENQSKIQSLRPYHMDIKEMPKEQVFHYPESLSSKRIMVRYGDEGGKAKDGVIELRKGVEDISLGNSSYAQVRILVDGTHYMKGMAMYNDNMPDGVDVIFNTNKPTGTPIFGDKKASVLKPIDRKKDGTPENNPFSANIKEKNGELIGQRWYTDSKGKERLSVINKVNEEGDWDKWSKTLSSQFLSKQPNKLVKQQLDISYKQYLNDFEDTKALTNPTIKKILLQEFADGCDKAAVDLKAAALPRQSQKVILPITSLKDNEVYAPGYNNGEKVVLIRHPHQGIFEIPTLTVNNKQKEAKSLLGNSTDAIGININVADRLSGADFDGDSVIVIPINDKVKVNTIDPTKDKDLKSLVGFDPKEAYPYREGMRVMSKAQKEIEMGKISNLITDMTLQGAPPADVARAVKHAQVVIDAEKHKLDYRKSYIDNDIKALSNKWQGRYTDDGKWTTSASTIVSKASGEIDVPRRKGEPNINPYTGEKSWYEMSYFDPKKGKTVTKRSKESMEYFNETTGKWEKKFIENAPTRYEQMKFIDYFNEKTGEWQKEKIEGAKTRTREVTSTVKSKQMYETDDAMTLISNFRHPNELAYAEYANKMKQLANEARKEIYSTEVIKKNSTAAKAYSAEVESLMAKFSLNELNRPREREANRLANSIIKAKIEDNPELKNDKDKRGKMQTRALQEARLRVGASGRNTRVHITDKEWEAIQAGAISHTTLKAILERSDKDELKQLAMPKTQKGLTSAQISLAKSMNAQGYTLAEIAKRLGVSSSTISKNIK